MTESGYYPAGAEHDPNAPYNQVELPEKEFKVTVTISVDKEVTVHTSDYCIDEDYDDGIGKCIFIDTSDTNWIEAYQEEHETIEGLLEEFKSLLEAKIEECENFPEDKHTLERYKYLKSECEGWITHDLEVVE